MLEMPKVAFFHGVLLISQDEVSLTIGSKMTVVTVASLVASDSRLLNVVITVATAANFSARGKILVKNQAVVLFTELTGSCSIFNCARPKSVVTCACVCTK